MYLNILGINNKEKITIPTNNTIPAPGQCISLNKMAILINDIDIAPEINASFFISICLILPTRMVFRETPRF